MGSSKTDTSEVRRDEAGVRLGFSIALHIKKLRSAMSVKCLFLFLAFMNAEWTRFDSSHKFSPPLTS